MRRDAGNDLTLLTSEIDLQLQETICLWDFLGSDHFSDAQIQLLKLIERD